MEALKGLVDGTRVTCSCLSWVVALVLIFQPALTTAAQVGYEPPATLNASQILPPDLLSGPNHRVEERIANDGYLNTYRVGSKFGTFTAVSTAMLRKRIGEINAMVRMEQIKNTKEFTTSLKEAGMDTLVVSKTLSRALCRRSAARPQVWTQP